MDGQTPATNPQTTGPEPTQAHTGPILTILEDGTEYHPAEYAAFWGDGSDSDGCRYYGCSEQVRPGCVIANPDWGSDDWQAFASTIREDLRRVRYTITKPDADGTGWTEADAANLERLAQWADARAKGPQRFTYMDGESGAEIVRISESVVYGCSGSGSQDSNVAAAMKTPEVEWLADAATIRKYLAEYGAWDASELADDESNRERALWLACCDCSEQPESYAD